MAATKTIASSNNQHEILSRATLEAVAIVTLGKIEFGNQRLAESFGYELNELEGRDVSDLIEVSMRDLFAESLKRAGEPFETHGLRKDGSSFSIEVVRRRIAFDDPKQYAVIFRDIARLKKVERALIRTEREYKKLFEDSKDAVYISSRDGHLMDVNQAAMDLFGYTREELLNLNSEELYADPRDRLIFQEEIEKYGAVRDFAVTLKRKDGQLLDCLLTSSVRMGHDSTVTGYQGIIHDITSLKKAQELKKAKELAEQSEKLKTQFLANMSHEIRTPMNAVYGMTNLLLQTEMEAKQREYVEFIKASSDHLLVLVNDILDFSRIDAGKVEINESDFDLHELIGNLITTLRFKVAQGSVELRLDIGEHVPNALRGDEVRLNQILLNLLSNAIKFTHKGEIVLKVRTIERNEAAVTLSFEVRDTGIGIVPEKLDSIFASFTQLVHDSRRKYQGTGLGLAITKKLVEVQGGTISVRSTPSQGTTFQVILAYRHSRGAPAARSAMESTDSNMLGAKRILVAEDNRINQIVARETIIKWAPNLKVDTAENGEECVELVKKNDYDLVIMDIQMPVMDGYEATRLIRELPEPKCYVPILAMTAYASPADAEMALSMGLDDYISKPFEPQDLFRKLSRLLGHTPELTAEPAHEPPMTATPSSGLIDLSYLNKVTEGENALRVKLVDMLLEETPVELEKMHRLLEEHKLNALGATAHRFKSSAILFGVKDLATDLKALELIAREGKDLEKVRELLEKVTKTCTQACIELKKEREDWHT